MEVGPGVFSVAPGDRGAGFVPACGSAPAAPAPWQPVRPGQHHGHRHVAVPTAHPVTTRTATTSRWPSALGTFAHHTVVHEASCIKIDKDSADWACLLGCGVVTGWGPAVYAADVQPGDTVAVVGRGGIAQRHPGRQDGRRRHRRHRPRGVQAEKAMEFGATHPRLHPGRHRRPGHHHLNRGFDNHHDCGVGNGDVLGEAFGWAARSKMSSPTSTRSARPASLSRCVLTVFRQLIGSLFGPQPARHPRPLELYTQGQLDLDGLVTRTYPLEGINDGYGGDERRREHPWRARV